MILTVSIKNDVIFFGLVLPDEGSVLFTFSLSADMKRTVDEYALEILRFFDYRRCDFGKVDASILCSVVPGLTSVITDALRHLSKSPVYTVRPGLKTGFRINIENPGELGADIVANVSGACEKMNSSFILIDMDSATTVSAVAKKEDGSFEFLGCSILPGMSSMKKDVESSAALISETAVPKNIDLIGNNTADSVASGIYYGYSFMIDGFIRHYADALHIANAAVIATGREVPFVLPLCQNTLLYEPDLTLRGLTVLYKRNQKK